MINIGSLVGSLGVTNFGDLSVKERQNFVKNLLKKSYKRKFVYASEKQGRFTVFNASYFTFLLGGGHVVADVSMGDGEISLRDSNYSHDTFRFSEEYRRLTGETLRVAKNT
jgi:hypothetical protein